MIHLPSDLRNTPFLEVPQHRPVALRLDQSFQHPDATELNQLLQELGDSLHVVDIEQVGWKFADANEDQSDAIQKWCETLNTQQNRAFERGRNHRRVLMETTRLLPPYLEFNDFKNLYDTSHSVRNILHKFNPVQTKELEDATTLIRKASLIKGSDPKQDLKVFDGLVTQISALPPGRLQIRAWLRLISTIPKLPEKPQCPRCDRILSLLKQISLMEPHGQVLPLTALVYLLTRAVLENNTPRDHIRLPLQTKGVLSERDSWFVLNMVHGHILKLTPTEQCTKLLLAWLDAAASHTYGKNYERQSVKRDIDANVYAIFADIKSRKPSDMEATLLRIEARMIAFSGSRGIRFDAALKDTRKLNEQQTDHLSRLIAYAAHPLVWGDAALKPCDGLLREIQSVPSRSQRAALLAQWLKTLKALPPHEISGRFRKAWHIQLSLNEGVLKPSDFDRWVRALGVVPKDAIAEAFKNLLKFAVALEASPQRQRALQTLEEQLHLLPSESRAEMGQLLSNERGI